MELLNCLEMSCLVKATLINAAIRVACMHYQLGILSFRHTQNVRGKAGAC